MLYNSGTPSLLSFTRDRMGDRSGAAAPQWVDAEVLAALNVAYLRLRAIAKMYRAGSGLKRTYATGVADQIYYAKPDDLTHLEAVEVSTNGSDLSTTAPASAAIISLKPWPADKALLAYNTKTLTEIERCFIQDQHFGIVAPLSATEAGTNSIRILYGASTTLLVNTTDEPDIPRDFHALICYMACVDLLMSRQMDVRDMRTVVYGDGRVDRGMLFDFKIAMQDELAMPEDEIDTAGTRIQDTSVVVGTVKVV